MKKALCPVILSEAKNLGPHARLEGGQRFFASLRMTGVGAQNDWAKHVSHGLP